MVSPAEQTKALSKRLGDWLRYASVQQGAAHASGGFFSTPRARQVSLRGVGHLRARCPVPGWPLLSPRGHCVVPGPRPRDAVRSLRSGGAREQGRVVSPSAHVLASYEGAPAVLGPSAPADLPCPLQPGPVTEVDGTVATDFFTVLSTGQRFTEDQRLNVQAFSMLRAWLLQAGPAHPSATDAGGTGWAPGCLSQTCQKARHWSQTTPHLHAC